MGPDEKVLLYVWKLGHNRLRSLLNLFKRGIVPGDVVACSGCQHVETESHLFFECPCYSRIWTTCFKWIGISTVMHNNCKNHYKQFSGLLNCRLESKKCWQVVWFAMVRAIWLARNNCIFNNKMPEMLDVLESVKVFSWSWIKVKCVNFNYPLSSWVSAPTTCLGLM